MSKEWLKTACINIRACCINLLYLKRKDKKISNSTIKRVAIAIIAIGIASIVGGTIYLNSGYAGTNIFESLICIGIFLISGLLLGLATEII